MKKTILSMLFIGSSIALFAQNPITDSSAASSTTDSSAMNNMDPSMSSNDTVTAATTTGNYNAYATNVNVPMRFQTSFSAEHPDVSNAMWSQVGDFYRATYGNNGRFNHVFYGNNGSSYSLALPVVMSYVPEEVIAKVGSMYGPSIYSINRIKTSNGQDAYLVTLADNGQTRTEWIRDDGSTVQNVDVYRTEQPTVVEGTELNNNLNKDVNAPVTEPMDNNVADSSNVQAEDAEKIKMKIKTSDGKKVKVKEQKRKVKVKKDD
jgi:hypothetical protein